MTNKYLLKKKQVDLYHFHYSKECVWADIIVIETGADSGNLMINSDYGNWCYVWTHCGKPFKFFLSEVDKEYLMHKLNQAYANEVNWDKTKERIIKEVNETLIQIYEDDLENSFYKRGLENLKDFFNEEWEHEVGFYYVVRDNVDYDELFSAAFGDDLESIFVKEYPIHLRKFMEEIWPDFIQVLKDEINGNR